MINPVTGEPFTTADIDRILGLADQFMEDWEQSEPSDLECKERRREWDALRPQLLQLADLLALRGAVGQFIRLGAISQQDYNTLLAAFDKVKQP
jgi:hypothetical protein